MTPLWTRVRRDPEVAAFVLVMAMGAIAIVVFEVFK